MTRFTALNAPDPDSESDSDSSTSSAASAANGSTSDCTTFHPKRINVKQYERVGMYMDTFTMDSDSENNQKDISIETECSDGYVPDKEKHRQQWHR